MWEVLNRLLLQYPESWGNATQHLMRSGDYPPSKMRNQINPITSYVVFLIWEELPIRPRMYQTLHELRDMRANRLEVEDATNDTMGCILNAINLIWFHILSECTASSYLNRMSIGDKVMREPIFGRPVDQQPTLLQAQTALVTCSSFFVEPGRFLSDRCDGEPMKPLVMRVDRFGQTICLFANESICLLGKIGVGV